MGESSVSRQSKGKRTRNFTEVSLGYSKKVAIEEAQRFPQSINAQPLKGCPLRIDIPAFIRLLREGNSAAALKKIKEQNPFPSVCGRICPAPCEAAYVLTEQAPINIRALERFAADSGKEWFESKKPKVCAGPKIAIIGSGAAGLSAAAFLAREDFQVTIFEAMEEPGGMLRYGVAEFRLPREVLEQEINTLKMSGVEIKTNHYVGRTLTWADLSSAGFEAVILATGKRVDLDTVYRGQTDWQGVYFAEEFMLKANQYGSQKILNESKALNIGYKIAVLGSNFTALDCARVAVRLDRDAAVLIASSQEDIPLDPRDLQFAMEEGVQLEVLTKPLEILADDRGCVKGVKCLHMDYADPNSTGRWELIPVEGSEFIFEADTVIVAGEPVANIFMEETFGVKRNPAHMVASHANVFIVPLDEKDKNNVVEAIAAGKDIAGQVVKYFRR